MKILFKQLFLIAFTIVLFSACSEDDDPKITVDISDLELLHEEVTDTDLIVQVYSNEQAFSGYNQLYFLLKKASDNMLIENATITIMPMMDMTEHSHSAPTIQPYVSEERRGLQQGAVIFTMPSGDMGKWTLSVKVAGLENGQEIAFDFEVPVISKEATYQAQDVKYQTLFKKVINNQRYFFAYHLPEGKPAIGVNDFEVYVYKQLDMMTYEAVDGLTISIEPEMPSMGHGSPNNVDPIGKGNGRYAGSVNFSMSGDWAIWLTIAQGGEVVLTDAAFYLEF
ncbi:FixH family protein [Fulvivirga sp. 29W222]|uniref:FixH family protein n=1 Tax=Fulvivirga marina TaxID=2494733 RepID=A0A937FYI5_9BACT|nr:FixH family protein [Fulvivirga marina]MBL6446715.1 FixH family protein [Fulvivirga marina]